MLPYITQIWITKSDKKNSKQPFRPSQHFLYPSTTGTKAGSDPASGQVLETKKQVEKPVVAAMDVKLNNVFSFLRKKLAEHKGRLETTSTN